MNLKTLYSVPEQIGFIQQATHINGWSDHYGALHVASFYSGLVMPRRYIINGIWQHGVFGPWDLQIPKCTIYNSPAGLDTLCLVAKDDLRAGLIELGYSNVQTIGMPINYLKERNFDRIPDSLLVMPSHSLVGFKYKNHDYFLRYAEEIYKASKNFKTTSKVIRDSRLPPQFNVLEKCSHRYLMSNDIFSDG